MGTTRLRRNTAIYTAKLAAKLIRRIGKGRGDTLPGRIARFICPDILALLAREVRGKIIVTTGTNGKTTVNSIICHALECEGRRVIINKTGSNMINGITAAFVLAAGRNGRTDTDYACIEVDELAAAKAFPELRPDIVLLTNISRDQLDRFGEVDITCSKIRAAVSSVPDAVLVVNCDDLLSYGLSLDCPNHAVTYGINERVFDETSRSDIRESIFCKVCGEKLTYEFFHYGQLGIYKCPHCGFERPVPDYTASQINHAGENYSFYIKSMLNTQAHSRTAFSPQPAGDVFIDAPLRFSYNVYNILCVYAALRTAHIPHENFSKSIETFDYGNNRESVFTINDASVQLHLAKNPVGFQQKISFIMQDPNPKDIIIQINDTFQDGKDVSWLWDVDFGYLSGCNAVNIFASGSRRFDMGLRLKYEDIPCRFTTDMRETVKDITSHAAKNLYIIVNYSGLYETNRMLAELQSAQNERNAQSRQNAQNGQKMQNSAGIGNPGSANSGQKRKKRFRRFFREIFTKEV